jgi:hypothetical protein
VIKLKRIILTTLSVLVLSTIPFASAFAATTANVTVTATPSFVAITNSPSTYDFATVAASATPASGTGTFTISNTSSVAINITIWAVAFTGGTGWTLNTTGSPGADQAGLYAGITGSTYPTVVTTSPGAELAHSITASASQTWGLKLMVPTSFTDGTQKTTTVTVSAAVHT